MRVFNIAASVVLTGAFLCPAWSAVPAVRTPEGLAAYGKTILETAPRTLQESGGETPDVPAATPALPALAPAESLSTPWVGEWHEKALEAKAAAKPHGLCVGAEGIFSYSMEEGQPLTREALLVTGMEVVKMRMSDYIARQYPDGETQLRMIADGWIDVSKPGDVEKYVGRVLPEGAPTGLLLTHSEEFAAPAKRTFLHTDAVYQHRAGPGQEIFSDLLRFLVLIDLEKQELSLVGSGDCEF